VEKKKDSYEIVPGNLTYYSAGEQHQVLKIAKSSHRINIEIFQSFFSQFDISDNLARQAITKNPDAKFLMIKMYHELLENDSFSDVSIQMLLLQLISQD
jgi:AraC family transcriptional regulator